jgi:TRAP-type C4-dicarboxylate transport system substrate-binding protein
VTKRDDPRRAAWGLAPLVPLVTVIAVVAAACGGSGENKAGGARHETPKPLTLTLFTGDRLFVPEYAAAVERLSGGAMRIDITVAGNQPAYEAKTVEDVRAGKVQLGAVGARVWDAFRVTSFRALVAPFLVDSLALEQRVLESPLAARMLAGLDRIGVVGLAVLPGPLRRPLGLSRALVGPSDYEGATIAIRFGGVARAAFRALGATVRGYTIGHLPPVDGAELDLNTIAANGYDAQARELTTNVVLWPRPQTIFMNQAAWDRLTPSQREVLRRAGDEALGPELARVENDDAAGLAGICGRGKITLASASPSELAALHRAVRPVYAELERDPVTRELIAGIGKLRATRTDTVVCPGSRAGAAAASRLQGLWQVTTSSRDLLAAGTPPGEAERQRGVATLELRAGHWVGQERHSGFVWSGSYAIHGNVLRVVTGACPPVPICGPRSIAEFTWSIYNDRLSLELLSGTPSYFGLIAKPLARVR